MNWTHEPDPARLALLDRLVRSNRTVWEGFSLDAAAERAAALRAALDGGCARERVAGALGVHPSEVDAVAWSGRPEADPSGAGARAGR